MRHGIDFLRAAHSEGEFVIVGFNLVLGDGDFAQGDGLAAGPLDQEPHAGHLVQHPKLGLVVLGAAAREDAVALDEDLGHVGDHPAGVPEGVALADPAVDELAVALVVGGRAQVAGTEDVGLGLDDAVLVREDPETVEQGQLLHFVGFGVVEDDGGPGAVYGQNCIGLGAQLLADDLVLVVGPDGEDAAH